MPENPNHAETLFLDLLLDLTIEKTSIVKQLWPISTHG